MLSEQARYGDLIVANPKTGPDGHVDLPGADLVVHFVWHGVNATADHIVPKVMGIGVVLLSRVIDSRADMLVFGAYGHARWLEHVLDGVTAYILEHMIVPAFMLYKLPAASAATAGYDCDTV